MRESGPGAALGEDEATALIESTYSEPVHENWRDRVLGDMAGWSIEQIADSAAMPQLLQVKVNPLVAYLAADVAAKLNMSRRGWMTSLLIEAICEAHPEIDKELLWKNAPNPRKLRRSVPIGTLGSGGRHKRRPRQPNDSESN